nr:MAG TPA: hypothetical protein [Crassvirales sp.]
MITTLKSGWKLDPEKLKLLGENTGRYWCCAGYIFILEVTYCREHYSYIEG